MTQHLVTHEMLVGLAQKRELSTVFEKAWQERTGVNPVARAIQMSQRKTIASGWKNLIFTSVAISISFGILLGVFGDSMIHEIAGILVLVPVMLVVSLVLRWEAKNPPIAYDGMDEFLADISALCIWLNPKSMSTEILLSSNENVVKFAAHSLLVSVVIPLVKLEQEKGGDAAERLRRVCEMDLLRKSFTHKYDTFARIGLASGGYNKYFDEAKRQAKKVKAAETAPAAM